MKRSFSLLVGEYQNFINIEEIELYKKNAIMCAKLDEYNPFTISYITIIKIIIIMFS